jgi:hypothetical protein
MDRCGSRPCPMADFISRTLEELLIALLFTTYPPKNVTASQTSVIFIQPVLMREPE